MERRMCPGHSWHYVRFGISFHLISVFLVWLLLSKAATAQSATSDARTLLTFRNQTTQSSDSVDLNTQPWFSWNETDETPCDWVGVSCTAQFFVDHLDFSGWGLDSRIQYMQTLSALPLLTSLNLSNNLLTGSLRDVSNFTELQELILDKNNIITLGDSFFSTARSVQRLSVSGNQLQGFIPPSVADMLLLEVLDLSDNQLSGQIPPEIAAVGFLYRNPALSLDLSRNFLTGPIPAGLMGPSEYSATPVGISVNLSYNSLSGQISTEINCDLLLKVFDVSNNQLCGSLSFLQPRSPLYNASFFAGNNGLCDGPLAPCTAKSSGVPLSVVLVIVGVFTIIIMGSCLAAGWRWRVYNRRHQQDAELIKTLLEGESAALMSLRELKNATNNFAESAQIGEGGFGKVYRGELSDGTIVAIKRSKREGFEKYREQFLNEVRILTQLNHRHLVKLLGCCMENKVAVLVFEFVSRGTLQEHLRRKFGAAYLSWKQRVNIAVQTADALSYLHSSATLPIYHRDVKSANVLLDDNLNAKVADFGISKLAPVEVTHVSTVAIQGTMGYIDPEYYTSFKLTDRSDVYGFGVVLLELISAKPVIDFHRCGDESGLVIFAKSRIESGDLAELIDPSLLETYLEPTGHGRESILSVGRLALKCLNMRSTARPSMQEVWNELQNLWRLVEPEGSTSRQSGTINMDAIDQIPQHHFFETRRIEMSQFPR